MSSNISRLPLKALAFRWRLALTAPNVLADVFQRYGEELARRGYFIDPRDLSPVKVRRSGP